MSLHPDFLNELKKNFHGDIRTDKVSRVLYATDASIYQIEPLGVAIPYSQDGLQAAVEMAAKYKIPILPRGSGSSLAGQAIGKALILDLSRHLDTIVAIDPESRTAIVEPGVILANLNKVAARHGLQFGPDPASAERATLGGVIGNNATGAHSIKYGMSADHLLAADVLLADGTPATLSPLSVQQAAKIATDVQETARFVLSPEFPPASITAALYSAALHIRAHYGQEIRDKYPRTWRNSAGYRLNYLLPWSATAPPQWSVEQAKNYPPIAPDTINLAPLLAGSEGTLAVIRHATINLVHKPRHTILGILGYPSVAAACDDVPRLLGLQPSAIELIPQMLVRLAKSVPAYSKQAALFDNSAEALLVIEFSGANLAELRLQAKLLGNRAQIVEDVSTQAHVWNVRKVGLGIFDNQPGSRRPVAFIEDCAIPVEKLGQFVREIEATLEDHDTHAAFYAHASAGCLHIRPLVDLRTGEGVRHLRSIAQAVLALTLSLGGSMSSEHGDGLLRSEFLKDTYGQKIMDANRLLKNAVDPHHLLNPGKIVDAQPFDRNLRYQTPYQPRGWQTVLDFSSSGGLVGAIEQCNGQGVCRKEGGVMCPSFQATREEKHATRGRANLLRALINLGETGLSQQQVKESLDLCLACKGCRSECPSSVDMAKLKYEFLHQYYRWRARKLRDYLFGYIHQISPVAAKNARLVNWMASRFWVQRLMSSIGITSKRTLPRFSSDRIVRPAALDPVERVIYLPDAFSRYQEPEVEQAAINLLAASAVEALELPVLGAGRTLLSKGFLDQAKAHAEKLVDAIAASDPNGEMAIVGVEPSEIYTLQDELLDLLPERHAEVNLISKRAFTVEEYLLRPGQGRENRVMRIVNSVCLPTKDYPLPMIHLHGHCYQKSRPPATDGYPVGQQASAELLRILGLQVEIIPSGCCGMAGAFGYEHEHYPVSMQVGELVLFPYLRNLDFCNGNVLIAAAGTSCRAQIADGVQKTAYHPLVVVADLINCPDLMR